MRNSSHFEISTELLKDIIKGLIEEVPGINNDAKVDIIITEENHVPSVKIKCSAKKEFVNIFQLALSIQEIVYFKLSKDFDAKNVIVNVEIA